MKIGKICCKDTVSKEVKITSAVAMTAATRKKQKLRKGKNMRQKLSIFMRCDSEQMSCSQKPQLALSTHKYILTYMPFYLHIGSLREDVEHSRPKESETPPAVVEW